MNNFFIKYYPYFFISALFLGITAPALWSNGMFMDGTIYAGISRNLAEAYGSFWNMKFSETIMNPFFGHPPLAFYLESLGFRIFGDSIYVERIYSLITGLLAILLIILILKSFIKTRNKSIIIISLILWLAFPLINWTYSNNMLENTVTVFVLSSFLFLLKNYERKRFLMLFISGMFLFAGFLSKGFTSLFIWCVPLIYWLIYRKIKFTRAVIDTGLLVVFTSLPFVLIYYFSEEARIFFENYFKEQIIGSISHFPIKNGRFFILKSLLNEMIIPVIIMFVLFITVKLKKKKLKITNENVKSGLFFFLIALSGILPIMISMKQRSFYIVPALPFLAISFGFIINGLLCNFSNILIFFKKKIFIFLSYGLLGISIIMIFIYAGRPGRDKTKIADIYELKKEIPQKEIFAICDSYKGDWSLYAYMQRYGEYSITTDTGKIVYFLTSKNIIPDTSYEKVNLNLDKYILYKKKD
ncbi:MAG: hypothetical protein GXO80_04000 [Chlorobi bacterium]|nr:hypothetical protein [Chlorobiota bacterium]